MRKQTNIFILLNKFSLQIGVKIFIYFMPRGKKWFLSKENSNPTVLVEASLRGGHPSTSRGTNLGNGISFGRYPSIPHPPIKIISWSLEAETNAFCFLNSQEML